MPPVYVWAHSHRSIRFAIKQSAMEAGHYWHMFVANEISRKTTSNMQVERDVSYQYIGSSNASRGRPTIHFMRDTYEEYREKSSHD